MDGCVGVLFANSLMGFNEFSAPIMLNGSMEVDKNYSHNEGGINIDTKSCGSAHMHFELLHVGMDLLSPVKLKGKFLMMRLSTSWLVRLLAPSQMAWKILWRENLSTVFGDHQCS